MISKGGEGIDPTWSLCNNKNERQFGERTGDPLASRPSPDAGHTTAKQSNLMRGISISKGGIREWVPKTKQQQQLKTQKSDNTIQNNY